MQKTLLIVLVVIASCNKAMATNITDVENEMIAFFQKTLVNNFGEKDPLMSMMKALDYYKFHYVLEVDKKELKKVNKQLFPILLKNYFIRDENEGVVKRTVFDSVRYDPYHPIIGGLALKKTVDGNTYYQNELLKSDHPFIREICGTYDFLHCILSPVILGKLAVNDNNCRSDFETDRDIQMLLTLVFWRYLCSCANIDLYTGQDKTEFILEYMKNRRT